MWKFSRISNLQEKKSYKYINLFIQEIKIAQCKISIILSNGYIGQFFSLIINHKSMMIGWKVNRLTYILPWNETKWGLLFNIASLVIHTFLLSILKCLDLIGQKSLWQRIWHPHMNFSVHELFSTSSYIIYWWAKIPFQILR